MHPNIFLMIQGGIGKSIAATAVVKALKKRYDQSKIFVITSHPIVFENNPNVYKVYNQDKWDYIFKNFIIEKNVKFYYRNPYFEHNHLCENEHLIETWIESCCELDYEGELPEIYLSKKDIEKADKIYKKDSKPILVLHTNGGYNEEIQSEYNWARDLPPHIVHEVISKYKDSHTIYNIQAEDREVVENTIPATQNIKYIARLLQLADKTLLIDSFSQHLAMALRKKCNVFWGFTSPEVFGYEFHNNIIRNINTRPPTFSCSRGINIIEPFSLLPYNNIEEIISIEKIFNELDK